MEKYQLEFKTKKDSIQSMYGQVLEANYFSLDYNDNAMDYYEGYDIEQLSNQIRDEIKSLNENPEGNPLTKYGTINGNRTYINKIKILNHRWIIADFNAGKVWGEVLIKYFVNDGKPTDFETVDSFVYSTTVN
ncbi:hydrolase [Flavobacterium sp. NST-5]|uniref:Hydrolase n=1 Tax=Flavobacterium ichthyis TaxID=2698827 RepID=A0ABW9ZB16_9FLAO|nr:hydrolase [Flavobacterium ichthyis]